MASPPAAIPSPFDALAKGVELKLNVSGTLPGEAVLSAALAYAASIRESMDKDLLKRFDAVWVQQYEDLQKIWRGIWVGVGLLKGS